jgi:hypothetical protein
MALFIPVFTINRNAFTEHVKKIAKVNDDMGNNVNKIIEYNRVYNENLNNELYIENYLKMIFQNYQYENSKKIFIPNCEINYIIEMILHLENKYFNKILETLNVDTISKIPLRNSYNNNNYFKYKKLYLEIMYKNIFESENNNLLLLLDKYWDNLKLQNLIDFTSVLMKLNDNDVDIDKYNSFINNKLNDIETLKKFITIIRNMYNSDKNNKIFYLKINYIINNLMTDGLLLFQEFEKDVIDYYSKNRINYSLKDGNDYLVKKCETDIEIIKMFIDIIYNKDKTLSSRNINEILLRIKSFLTDIRNNYLDNDAYIKINIVAQSNKYKNFDVRTIDRKKCIFKMLKYNICTDNSTTDNCIFPDEIQMYIDIYKSYFNMRYPDRVLSFNLFSSPMVIKYNINSEIYHIHMSIIQFILLDIINKNKDGIDVFKIASMINIKLKLLESTFNSLLKIKLIKRNTDYVFYPNNDFTYPDKKISIFNLVNTNTNIDSEKIERQFVHDKNLILQCNVVNFAKKNREFTLESLNKHLSKVIPFIVDEPTLTKCLEKCVNDNYLLLNDDKYVYEELE